MPVHKSVKIEQWSSTIHQIGLRWSVFCVLSPVALIHITFMELVLCLHNQEAFDSSSKSHY